MSFDVFLLPCHDGSRPLADHDMVRALLEPYVVRDEDGSELPLVRFKDGEANVFGTEDLSNGFMATHIGGEQAWDLLVRIADRAPFVIVPVGCPAMVTREELVAGVLEMVEEGVRVVTTGAEAIQVVVTS